MSAKVQEIFVTENDLLLLWRSVNTEVITVMQECVERKMVQWDRLDQLKNLRDKIQSHLDHFHDDENFTEDYDNV
jgi:hypothetical protein